MCRSKRMCRHSCCSTLHASNHWATAARIQHHHNISVGETVRVPTSPSARFAVLRCIVFTQYLLFAFLICAVTVPVPPGTYVLDPWLSVLCMRSKAWLAARVSLRLARLPRTASSAQRSRRLRSTRAAAPVLLAHANVTENINIFSMGPKLRYPTVAKRVRAVKCTGKHELA